MSKPGISDTAVRALLQREFGAVSALEPLQEGEESRAFAFDGGGRACVVRINRSAQGFEKDAWVQRRFAREGLPIPEIVAMGMLDDGHAWCVSHRAAGVTLQALAPAELPAVVGDVARVLDVIAACDLRGTQGYGRFDAKGVGSDSSWRAFLSGIRARDMSALKHVADRRRVEAWIDEVVAFADGCADVRGLIHGDFGSNNVLVDAGRISAVIDWSEALYGDPLYDVANILFWRPWLDCMEQQARYFEAARPDRLADAVRLRAYQLHIGLEQIHQSALAGADDDLAWALRRCAAIAVA